MASKGDDDEQVIEMLNEDSETTAPSNFFEREPTDETTLVRTMNFALRSLILQLRNPIDIESEAICKWIIYKQSGPQRHQKFFGFFRQLYRQIRKYNDIAFLKKINPVLKKAENSGNSMYKLDPVALKYVGATYVKRVFLLEKIRESSVKCADLVIGLLELEQWINLSLVIFSLCAQIHAEIVEQLIGMERAWKTGATVFRTVDSRFPEDLGDLKIVKKLKTESRVFEERNAKMEQSTGISALSRLLKFSAERIEEAHVENDLRMRTTEILKTTLLAEMTSISTPESSSTKSRIQSDLSSQFDTSDLGISVSREDDIPLSARCTPMETLRIRMAREEEERRPKPPEYCPKTKETLPISCYMPDLGIPTSRESASFLSAPAYSTPIASSRSAMHMYTPGETMKLKFTRKPTAPGISMCRKDSSFYNQPAHSTSIAASRSEMIYTPGKTPKLKLTRKPPHPYPPKFESVPKKETFLTSTMDLLSEKKKKKKKKKK